MASKLTTEHGAPEDEVPKPPEPSHSVPDPSFSLTAEEENPMITREGNSKYVLDNEGHNRYLRLGRSLLYMKDPLHEPMLTETEKLHKKLLEAVKKIDMFKSGGNKEKENILRTILQKYLNSGNEESNKIYINNVNIQKWESLPWETGKAFMQSGQTEENKGPVCSDIMGILRLLSGCKQFNGWLEAGTDDTSGHTKIQEVLKVRNLVAHSRSLCCSEKEMENGIEQVKILLEHIKQKFKRFTEDETVSEDEKSVYQNAEEKMEDALDKIDKVRTDTDFDVMRKLIVEDVCKSRAYESSDETQRKELATVQLRFGTLRLINFLNDLYKNRLEDFKVRLQKQKALQSFIIEADPGDVQFLLAALDQQEMFKAENLDALPQLIEPLHNKTDFRRIKKKIIDMKKIFERTSAIAAATVYDVLILHCEADAKKAMDFRQHYLDTLAFKIILYEEYVVGGTGHVSALDHVLEDCRLVFILCTQDFNQDNLSQFQAEVVKYYSLQINEGRRVVFVYLTEEDSRNAPKWMNAMVPINVWNQYGPDRLQKTLENGRKSYLTSSR